MKFSRLFGGYIDFPGEAHVMGLINCERKPYKCSGLTVSLAKRYHSPAEAFTLQLGWRNHSLFLYLTLVPEKRLWIAFAAVVTLVAMCLGRADLGLWGEHRWTGGNYDFYVHGPIPYKLTDYCPVIPLRYAVTKDK